MRRSLNSIVMSSRGKFPNLPPGLSFLGYKMKYHHPPHKSSEIRDLRSPRWLKSANQDLDVTLINKNTQNAQSFKTPSSLL